MKKSLIAAGIIVTHAFVAQAFAQGEVGPVKPAKPPAQISAQEKSEARAERKVEGAQAARQQSPGLVGPKKPMQTGQSDKTRDEVKAGARAENQATNRSDMPQRGEVGQTKAHQ